MHQQPVLRMENTTQKEIDLLNKQVNQQSNLLQSMQKVSELQTKMLLEENEKEAKNFWAESIAVAIKHTKDKPRKTLH